jgi:hypothetical protein
LMKLIKNLFTNGVKKTMTNSSSVLTKLKKKMQSMTSPSKKNWKESLNMVMAYGHAG